MKNGNYPELDASEDADKKTAPTNSTGTPKGKGIGKGCSNRNYRDHDETVKKEPPEHDATYDEPRRDVRQEDEEANIVVKKEPSDELEHDVNIKEEVFSDGNGDESVKNTSQKKGDTSESSEEIIIIKSKISRVSLRKSTRIQKRKMQERKKFKELEDRRGKRLAAKFIYGESGVTYRPPRDFYGKFGVDESEEKCNPPLIVLDDDDKDYNDDHSSVKIIDDVSNQKKQRLKKPKVGFIQNEVVSDGDEICECDGTIDHDVNESKNIEKKDYGIDQVKHDEIGRGGSDRDEIVSPSGRSRSDQVRRDETVVPGTGATVMCGGGRGDFFKIPLEEQ